MADHRQLGALMGAQMTNRTHRIRQEVFNLVSHGASLYEQIGDVPARLGWHLRFANVGRLSLGTSFHLAHASFHKLSASRSGWIEKLDLRIRVFDPFDVTKPHTEQEVLSLPFGHGLSDITDQFERAECP